MKKFEYKMAEIKTSLGFDWQKKIREAEARWNELGREGWQFCMHGDGVIVFMREIEESTTNISWPRPCAWPGRQWPTAMCR